MLPWAKSMVRRLRGLWRLRRLCWLTPRPISCTPTLYPVGIMQPWPHVMSCSWAAHTNTTLCPLRNGVILCPYRASVTLRPTRAAAVPCRTYRMRAGDPAPTMLVRT